MLIAQVSDIHAGHDNGNLHRFDRVLAWLAHLNPDILVLTGDVIDERWHAGYQMIADRLSRQKYPSLLLPGNTDDRRHMCSVWGERHWANDGPGESLHFTYHAGGLRLIGLDSTLENESSGSLSGHIEWLEKQLSDTGDSPALLFLHHHVVESGIPTLDKIMCAGTRELAALIQRAPGKLLAIASGHVHRPVAGVFAGIPAYICGSVCPANPVWFGTENRPPVSDPPALMIYRYVGNVHTGHHVSV
ncbi:metallophosphoesterase [Martelella alba]|uniref:Metallophosphoesterase n=1 Tax=Martelella alba TaxID=2590451 RepID=A0ABY2SJQ2_9HYPH|nr:metallophosphoesterase [Martelella alba]TKI04929.1 metallophosphoesterase [Martelella alba]